MLDFAFNDFLSADIFMVINAKKVSFVTGMFSCLLLAGCGGAPSESEIKATVEKQQAQDLKNAGPVADLLPTVKVLKKVGCKEDGEKAYKCDLEVEVTQLNKTQTTVAPLRFVKTSDGWMISK